MIENLARDLRFALRMLAKRPAMTLVAVLSLGLGIGAIEKRVVVVTDELGNDTIGIRPRVYLTLTFDHRILDGAEADHFLAKVVEGLEGW